MRKENRPLAYDEQLAGRAQPLLKGHRALVEKKMSEVIEESAWRNVTSRKS